MPEIEVWSPLTSLALRSSKAVAAADSGPETALHRAGLALAFSVALTRSLTSAPAVATDCR